MQNEYQVEMPDEVFSEDIDKIEENYDTRNDSGTSPDDGERYGY